MVQQIRGFEQLSDAQREAAAAVLKSALRHAPAAWRNLSAARAEVDSFFEEPDRAAIALIENEALIGWAGRISRYDGNAWELHPLVVSPTHQRQGCGRRLMAALEDLARSAGVSTIFLGADDDFAGTSLFGHDLYPDPLVWASRIEPTGDHPFVFYRKVGYAVVGVLPDANGPGKPDILMAKRVRPHTSRG